MLEYSSDTQQLVASQEGLNPMELVSLFVFIITLSFSTMDRLLVTTALAMERKGKQFLLFYGLPWNSSRYASVYQLYPTDGFFRPLTFLLNTRAELQTKHQRCKYILNI
jgi:hypothetical protein